MSANALDALAGTVSVSYQERIGPANLDRVLRTGGYDARWAGHITTLVEETPIEMLADAIASFPPSEQQTVIDSLLSLGRVVGSDRIERWMRG